MDYHVMKKALVPVLLLTGSVLVLGKGVMVSSGSTQPELTSKSNFNPTIMEDHLVEDFESGMPADWTLDTHAGSPGWQVGNTVEAGQSQYLTFPDHTHFAYCNSDNEGEGTTFDDWMISPEFDLPDAEFIYLEFVSYFRNQPGSEWDNWGEVSIRSNSGAWTVIAEMEASGGNDFELLTYNLGEWSGENAVQIGFHFWDDGNWGFGWGVDDVLLFSADGDVFPPEIDTIPIYNHLNPPDPIDINATVTDDSEVLSVTMTYRVNWGAWEDVNMVNTTGNEWDATIPPQSTGANVDYYLSAVDLSENANESSTLEFSMIVNPVSWLHRDDGETENGVGGNDAWYCAVTYYPAYLPLTINMIEIEMNYDETLEFHLWSLDGTGSPNTDLITPFEADVVGGMPSVIPLPQPIEVNQPFAVGVYNPVSGNYCGLDENGYFYENTTLVDLGSGWAPLSDYGFAGNYYIRAFVQYQSQAVTELKSSVGTFTLVQNHPNPFNPTTTIDFSLTQPSAVSITVFDLIGNQVATLVDGSLGAGSHSVVWNAVEQPSGLYFYTLRAGGQSVTRKMILVK